MSFLCSSYYLKYVSIPIKNSPSCWFSLTIHIQCNLLERLDLDSHCTLKNLLKTNSCKVYAVCVFWRTVVNKYWTIVLFDRYQRPETQTVVDWYKPASRARVGQWKHTPKPEAQPTTEGQVFTAPAKLCWQVYNSWLNMWECFFWPALNNFGIFPWPVRIFLTYS